VKVSGSVERPYLRSTPTVRGHLSCQIRDPPRWHLKMELESHGASIWSCSLVPSVELTLPHEREGWLYSYSSKFGVRPAPARTVSFPGFVEPLFRNRVIDGKGGGGRLRA
jgi:hypothetical protein